MQKNSLFSTFNIKQSVLREMSPDLLPSIMMTLAYHSIHETPDCPVIKINFIVLLTRFKPDNFLHLQTGKKDFSKAAACTTHVYGPLGILLLIFLKKFIAMDKLSSF